MATLVQEILRVRDSSASHLVQRKLFLAEFNNTNRSYPSDKCVHELFERQVEKSPEAVALVSGDSRFTYNELNGRANQLARFLKRFGVGPDSLVGLCVERSPEMMVGILGILKAGAAYVPLDPAGPDEALSLMVQDANVFVLLTQSHLLDAVPPHHGPRLSLDSDWDIIAKERNDDAPTRTTADNLAYVMYSFDIAGRPKGVMIPHRAMVNYLSWCSEAYEVSKGHGALVYSSIGVDLTITSLFAPLLVGKTVFLIEDGIENLVEALLARDNYSLLKVTPANLRTLADLMPEDHLAGRVRALVIGGGPLRMEDLSVWRRHAPATRLINEYGLTETVVGSCVYEIQPEDVAFGPAPIGSPIANTQLYVLDQNLQPVEKGLAGELYVGGDGVGLGYLNQRELTDDRFIPDPFRRGGHARLYRTGDFAFLNARGILEYLGRRN